MKAADFDLNRGLWIRKKCGYRYVNQQAVIKRLQGEFFDQLPEGEAPCKADVVTFAKNNLFAGNRVLAQGLGGYNFHTAEGLGYILNRVQARAWELEFDVGGK